MDTNMKLRVAAASVIGARHQHAGRNGQDAAFAWCDGERAVAVVCDGCSSGQSSEVGARLGAKWFAEAMASLLEAGTTVNERAPFETVRSDVAAKLAALARGDGNKVHKIRRATSRDRSTVEGRLQNAASTSCAESAGPILEPLTAIDVIDADVVHEMLLFTIVALAVTPHGAAVWALGDGAYGCDGRTRVLGPFADNAPPYLAYDLFGDPRDAHFEVLPADAKRMLIATDGVGDLHGDLGVFGAITTANPDALRRRLFQLAQRDERIDWSGHRVVRTPAMLQDDCAIAIVERIS